MSFEQWMLERPRWMQAAAARLIESRRSPSDPEITALVELCKSEAAGTNYKISEKIAVNSLSESTPLPFLRIDTICDVTGVNALKLGASLDLASSNMSVVYGGNGSGKSGFARLLKQACGSRAKEDIHSNLFEGLPTPPKATIHIQVGGEPLQLHWSAREGAISELRDVHVFDTKAAEMYVNRRNEATYEPRRMQFLSALASICDRVAKSLASEQQLHPTRMPTMPAQLANGTAREWLSKLSADTLVTDVEAFCEYPASFNAERISIDLALAQQNSHLRLQTIAKEKIVLNRIKDRLSPLKEGLSDEAIECVIAARRKSAEMRRLASYEAEGLFRDTPLGGVGQSAWIAMWEQARKYSMQHAYPDVPYPAVRTGDRCVLCQSVLEPESAQLLSHFEGFVRHGLETAAAEAAAAAESVIEALSPVPALHDWLGIASNLKMGEGEAAFDHSILESRRSAAVTSAHLSEVPGFKFDLYDLALVAANEGLELEEQAIRALEGSVKRAELENRLSELKAREWLNQNVLQIKTEISRLNLIRTLERATSLTKTNALTAKKNELARLELDAGYKDRFATELCHLGGGRIPVSMESKEEGKARISFQLAMTGSSSRIDPHEVMSEGEARVVALAAFLADLSGSGRPAPFIFDDPISSLDQDFEERVAARLVGLSKVRQVIVFTHRLSLLSLIETAAEKATLYDSTVAFGLKIQALHRSNKTAGIVQEQSIREMKPDKAANRMRDQVISELRKLADGSDMLAYQAKLQSSCTEFRLLIERCVEKILLGDVVGRFRRSVETKGKLHDLTKIGIADCNLIDDLMTRYSVFEHSQPDELPASLPELDRFHSDIADLADWIQSFKTRKAA